MQEGNKEKKTTATDNRSTKAGPNAAKFCHTVQSTT